MTRIQKISKLANAIRAYRGMFRPCRSGSKKSWIRNPQPSVRKRIVLWLERLHLDVAESLLKIDGFESFDEMRSWLNSL